MQIATVSDDHYQMGLIETYRFIPRQLIDFALRFLKPSEKIKLFSASAIAAQKAYNEVAIRAPYYESYTDRDLEQLTAVQKKAYLETFATFLFNLKKYK